MLATFVYVEMQTIARFFISASFFRLKLVGYIFDKLCYAQNCILNNSRFAPKLTYLHNTSKEMRGAPRCTFQPWQPPLSHDHLGTTQPAPRHKTTTQDHRMVVAVMKKQSDINLKFKLVFVPFLLSHHFVKCFPFQTVDKKELCCRRTLAT